MKGTFRYVQTLRGRIMFPHVKSVCVSSSKDILHTGGLLHLMLLGLLLCLLTPPPSRAEELRVLSLGVRGSVSAATVLGDEAPEEYDAYEVALNVGFPWGLYSASGWGVGTRLLTSAGTLHGAGETALTLSLIPGFALGSEDGRFALDLGAGVAYLSRHRFGEQDFGGPFQFALTVGAGIPIYQQLGAGYRFMHYSDAGANGGDTTGADLHMVEIRFQF